MNKAVDLSEWLANASRDCWLALNEEQTKIVGRGETVKVAVDEAGKNGVDDPVNPRQFHGSIRSLCQASTV